jgi:hypothetical protein
MAKMDPWKIRDLTPLGELSIGSRQAHTRYEEHAQTRTSKGPCVFEVLTELLS